MSVRKEIVFLDGRFVSSAKARVSPLDRGFLYGDGLFETIRIYSGEPFALEQHLRRLKAAGRRIQLPIPHTVRWWRETTVELLGRSGLRGRDAAVRITITRGVGGDGLLLPRKPRPTLLMFARPLPSDLETLKRRGVKVTLLDFHPGVRGLLEGLKTTDYLTAALGKTLARARGAFEGIYRTKAGEILEGTTSNVFTVQDGCLVTPGVPRGVLPGTTRDRVLSLARGAGIPIREGRLSVSGLLKADEAFLTASTIEIVPIVLVDDARIGLGEIPITRVLQDLYPPRKRPGSDESRK